MMVLADQLSRHIPAKLWLSETCQIGYCGERQCGLGSFVLPARLCAFVIFNNPRPTHVDLKS